MKLQDGSLSLFLVLLTGSSGCYSPTVDEGMTEMNSEETDSGSHEAGSSGNGTDPSATGASGTSSMGSTSNDPSATTAGESTETSPTSDPSTTTSDDTGSGGDSYCGDGVLDPGEDCDEGTDNALDGACLPDCNLNVCGDSNVGPEEACDEGEDDNILAPGACAPDCSGFIETREIVLGYNGQLNTGNLGPNPLATLDAVCPTGSAALVVVPGARQVTNTPYQANAMVDWPLSPFTQYVNSTGEQIWITDSVPLLGVRDGIPEALDHAFGSLAFPVTGMNNDWTANVAENCTNFTSSSAAGDLRYGITSETEGFLSSSLATTPCNDAAISVLCVEL